MVDFATEIGKAKIRLLELTTIRNMKKLNLQEVKLNLSHQEKYLINAEKAKVIIQNVANEIQADLEYEISNIVTMALSSVFDNPYAFKVEFVDRRNQTECDMFFVKDGNECDPMESSGGGAIDVASIALRMAVWSIHRTRAIQILDEPSRDLSRDMQEKCSEMLKMLSSELGIQMIIVSHIPEMITAADKIVNVDNIDGYSVTKVIQ